MLPSKTESGGHRLAPLTSNRSDPSCVLSSVLDLVGGGQNLLNVEAEGSCVLVRRITIHLLENS